VALEGKHEREKREKQEVAKPTETWWTQRKFSNRVRTGKYGKSQKKTARPKKIKSYLFGP
jgi:hypothetical protein